MHYGVEQSTLLRLKLPTHPNLFILSLSLSEALILHQAVVAGLFSFQDLSCALSLILCTTELTPDTCVSLWKPHLHLVGQHIVGKADRRLAECTTGTKYAFKLSSLRHKTTKQSKAARADNCFKGKGAQKSSCHLVVNTMKKISSFQEINTDHFSITFLSGKKGAFISPVKNRIHAKYYDVL